MNNLYGFTLFYLFLMFLNLDNIVLNYFLKKNSISFLKKLFSKYIYENKNKLIANREWNFTRKTIVFN